MEYKIEMDCRIDKLADRINLLLSENWVPLGGLSVDSEGNVFQALFRARKGYFISESKADILKDKYPEIWEELKRIE